MCHARQTQGSSIVDQNGIWGKIVSNRYSIETVQKTHSDLKSYLPQYFSIFHIVTALQCDSIQLKRTVLSNDAITWGNSQRQSSSLLFSLHVKYVCYGDRWRGESNGENSRYLEQVLLPSRPTPKTIYFNFKKKVIILERRAPECFNYLGLFTSSGYDNDPPLSQWVLYLAHESAALISLHGGQPSDWGHPTVNNKCWSTNKASKDTCHAHILARVRPLLDWTKLQSITKCLQIPGRPSRNFPHHGPATSAEWAAVILIDLRPPPDRSLRPDIFSAKGVPAPFQSLMIGWAQGRYHYAYHCTRWDLTEARISSRKRPDDNKSRHGSCLKTT